MVSVSPTIAIMFFLKENSYTAAYNDWVSTVSIFFIKMSIQYFSLNFSINSQAA